MENLDPNHY